VAGTGFANGGDNTYAVTYTIVEGNTDRTSGNVPALLACRREHGKEVIWNNS